MEGLRLECALLAVRCALRPGVAAQLRRPRLRGAAVEGAPAPSGAAAVDDAARLADQPVSHELVPDRLRTRVERRC